ncbi:MAG: putative N-acetyltransferase [Promethearchaeota archaeon]|nr:MAG: putative N-acetyltransferase [Candidatus Lokiarchaeota archaeon]
MRIRTVKTKDLGKLIRLEQDVFKDNAFSEELLQKLIERNFLFLKLESGFLSGTIIGFVIVLKDMRNRVNLINLLIDSDYQRKGYGKYLLAHTIHKVKKNRDIKTMILNVNVNNIAAIHLYQKFNFKIIKKIHEYYHSGEDCYLMELNLTIIET